MTPSASLPSEVKGMGRIAVIGAGIVGASVALQLQRAGFQTFLYDSQDPGQGASFGNAGLISQDSCIPVALPGLMLQVPRWLITGTGPLRLDWRDLPQALPWLTRWVLTTRPDKVQAIARAMVALHRPALDLYRALLGPELFSLLIHTKGQLHVWESEQISPTDKIEAGIREQQGVTTVALNADSLRDLVPAMNSEIRRGLLFPRHAHTVNPQALVQAFVDLFRTAGGQWREARIESIAPRGNGGFGLLGEAFQDECDQVVVCTGILANQLLTPLQCAIPMQAERGFHLHMPRGGALVPMPILNKSRGIVLTPMGDGLRAAGLVEIARPDRVADQGHRDALIAGVRALLDMAHQSPTPTLWVGSRPSTPDNLPVIDQVERWPGLFLACGHSHFGMTGAPMTGELVVNLVLGRASSVDMGPYRLNRF
jgi:glycine/D-amino acid oxidase-like deaminating enzyme